MWAGGKLGMAYYHVESMQVHMMADITENEDFTILKKGKDCSLMKCNCMEALLMTWNYPSFSSTNENYRIKKLSECYTLLASCTDQ